MDGPSACGEPTGVGELSAAAGVASEGARGSGRLRELHPPLGRRWDVVRVDDLLPVVREAQGERVP
eukprot:9990653-Alexandrium_andersonii.AAC.1